MGVEQYEIVYIDEAIAIKIGWTNCDCLRGTYCRAGEVGRHKDMIGSTLYGDDFLALNSTFGDLSSCPKDINEDGIVNIDDFLLMNSAFGEPCP